MIATAGTTRRIAVAAGLAGALAFGSSAAEDMPNFHFKSVGGASYMWQLPNVEIPWAESMSAETSGKVTGEILPYNQVGLRGFEMLRLLQVGALEFSRGDISTHGGDDPHFEALDFPGLTPTIDDVRKAAEAYRHRFDAILEGSGIKLLFLAPNTPQVIWCNADIKGVADLDGLKVRVYNKGLASFVEGAGGTPITMSSAEVVTAAQRGVIDCAITGTTNGNTGKWPEVMTHLLPLYMGWGVQYWAVNMKTWGPAPSLRSRLPGDEVRGAGQGAVEGRPGRRGAGHRLQRRPGVQVPRAEQLRHDPGRDLRRGPGADEGHHPGARAQGLGRAMRRRLREGVERHGRQRAGHSGPGVVTS